MPLLSDLQTDGLTHVCATCTRCNTEVCVPFEMLPPAAMALDLSDMPSRMRCRRCGSRPESVRAWAQHLASGFQRAFKWTS